MNIAHRMQCLFVDDKLHDVTFSVGEVSGLGSPGSTPGPCLLMSDRNITNLGLILHSWVTKQRYRNWRLHGT